MSIYNNARRGSLLEQSDCFGFSASFHYKRRWGYKETQSHTYRGFSRLSREQDRMDETTTNILRQNLFFKRECIQFSSFFSWRKQKNIVMTYYCLMILLWWYIVPTSIVFHIHCSRVFSL